MQSDYFESQYSCFKYHHQGRENVRYQKLQRHSGISTICLFFYFFSTELSTSEFSIAFSDDKHGRNLVCDLLVPEWELHRQPLMDHLNPLLVTVFYLINLKPHNVPEREII